MVKKIFSKNLYTMIVYLVITIVCIGISCAGLTSDSPFKIYPIVITAISFFFGGIYLLMSLFSMAKRVELTGSKGLDTARMMGGNFLRFSVLIIAIACNFLFIYFCPHEGEIEKWVYFLLLISGFPMFINIFLFFMRSKYVE